MESMYAVDIVQIDRLGNYLSDLEIWLEQKAGEILSIRNK